MQNPSQGFTGTAQAEGSAGSGGEPHNGNPSLALSSLSTVSPPKYETITAPLKALTK